ncbi:MAG: hypothetical protein AAGE98_12350 [Actinomycetota bacterium]
MTQHTPARYPNQRTVAQGWSGDIGLSVAFSLLLIVPAAMVAGPLGALVAIVIGPLLSHLANRMFVSPAAAPVTVSCEICGDLSLATSGRCSRHR